MLLQKLGFLFVIHIKFYLINYGASQSFFFPLFKKILFTMGPFYWLITSNFILFLSNLPHPHPNDMF